MSRQLTHAEVIIMLRQRTHGKQGALAMEAGVSEPFLSRVLAGKCPPSPKLLKLLGLARVTVYEPRDAA